MKSHCVGLVGLVLLPACSLHARLADLSSAEISCDQSNLEISESFATRSTVRYKATCSDGRAYRCITMGKPLGEEPETVCEREGDG